MTPEEEQYHRIRLHGRLGISGEEWVKHLKKSKSLNLPYSAPEDDRIAAAREKTDDLMSRMGDISLWDRAKLSFLGAGYQAKQGLLSEWSPNWYDYKGNWDSIWDFEKKKKRDN